MSRILPLIISLFFSVSAFAQNPLLVENVVRIKGQEENIIQGIGIVSGLNGSGDDPKSFSPAAHALLAQLAKTGMYSGTDVRAISGARNSALVRVTVTIPATGARDGDILDCTVVTEGNAKSLDGGVLSTTWLSTALQQDENSLVYAMAQGRVSIERTASPGVGRVVNGCRMRADFTNPYIKDGLLTLVIKPQYSHPRMANEIARAINNHRDLKSFSPPLAQVITPHYLTVRVPTDRFDNPMWFVETVLESELENQQPALPKVVINERAGTIAIDENVEVRPTLVTHRNFVVDMAPQLAPGEQEQFPRQFLDIDTATKFKQMNGEDVTNVKLKALQASMNSLRASQQDMIDIIKILHKQGAIIGDVEFVD
jgi:flagellar P-ring protein precursor FlgI